MYKITLPIYFLVFNLAGYNSTVLINMKNILDGENFSLSHAWHINLYSFIGIAVVFIIILFLLS